jgi:hypothetical protein
MVLNKNYPTAFGNRKVTVARVTGPAAYVQYVAPTTGGVNLQAFPEGVKDIDFALGGPSDSGLYRVEPVYIEASSVQGRTLGRTQVVLKVYVIATGAEAAADLDLDAETFSVLLIGGQ